MASKSKKIMARFDNDRHFKKRQSKAKDVICAYENISTGAKFIIKKKNEVWFTPTGLMKNAKPLSKDRVDNLAV
jgi:hypothetical protein